jgi:tetratricopeptide (TPR) repeat protein
MINSKIYLIIISFVFLACGTKTDPKKINPIAVKLNDSAMGVFNYVDNIDSANKAIKLLDSATELDSNYFLAYYNKLIILNQQKDYDKAIETIKNLVRISPNANDTYFNGGIIYELMGDTISSRRYFQKSLEICNKILDTMSAPNKNYALLAVSKSANLIMLGQQINGNLFLKQVYEKQADSSLKQWMYPFLNKTKQGMIDIFLNPEKDMPDVSRSGDAVADTSYQQSDTAK